MSEDNYEIVSNQGLSGHLSGKDGVRMAVSPAGGPLALIAHAVPANQPQRSTCLAATWNTASAPWRRALV